jgi:hypothetical protein
MALESIKTPAPKRSHDEFAMPSSNGSIVTPRPFQQWNMNVDATPGSTMSPYFKNMMSDSPGKRIKTEPSVSVKAEKTNRSPLSTPSKGLVNVDAPCSWQVTCEKCGAVAVTGPRLIEGTTEQGYSILAEYAQDLNLMQYQDDDWLYSCSNCSRNDER